MYCFEFALLDIFERMIVKLKVYLPVYTIPAIASTADVTHTYMCDRCTE